MSVKILVIDDNPQVLELIKDTVQPMGWCEVVTLMDSRNIAQFLEHQKFEGLVVKAHMPHLNGFDVTRQVRASRLNAEIPVVLVTEKNDIQMMREGFKAGITFFAVRPTNRLLAYRLFSAVRGAMISEKRRRHRLPYRTTVDCRWGQHGERHFVAESLEISEGGIKLRPSGGLETGQELTLELLLPEVSQPASHERLSLRESLFGGGVEPLAGPQILRGKVCYVTGADFVGLEFVGLLPEHREAIRRYVSGGLGEEDLGGEEA
jgi:CheY-like chemotaxis protein